MLQQIPCDVQEEINQSLLVLQEIFSHNLLGVYLYGSAVIGGLQKYSDVDLLVVIDRATSQAEKTLFLSYAFYSLLHRHKMRNSWIVLQHSTIITRFDNFT